MTVSRVVLALTVFSSVVSAAGCGPLRSAVAARPMSHPAFVAITHVPVGLLTVDPTTGTLYGVTSGGIIAIDTSNQEHQVFATGPDDYMCGLAIDGADHHLLVNFLHYDHLPSGRHIPPATSVIQVVDALSGGLLNTVTIQRNRLLCPIGSPTLVVVDPTADHGFVTDTRGHSVEVDMDTGTMLRRFHVPPPYDFGSFAPSDALPWVVDSTHHRLVVSTVPSCQNTCTTPILLVTVDTQSGRIVRRAGYTGGPVGVLALDATTGRVYFRPDLLGHGDIFTLDDRTGRITGRVRVTSLFAGGEVTGNIVADSVTHRAYIYIGGTALKGTGFPGRHNGPAHLIEVNGRGTRVLRRVNLPNPRPNYFAGGAFVDGATGRLFVQIGVHLVVLDPSTLHIIQTIRLTPILNGKYIAFMLDTTNHRILFYGSGGIVALDE
ncbi:MAG TPA: hypothetical protein VFA78_01405 [Chloroflexota bacterium]|nr:hypothetical protein [Chloroflexota bacterium]